MYLDSIRDLLDSSNFVTQSNKASQFEATQVQVASEAQIFSLIKRAEAQRQTAETSCNEQSSRSHCIF